MRHLPELLLTAVIAVVGLTACNSAEQKTSTATKPVATTQTAPVVYADGVRRVTPVELQAMLANGEALAVDVRSEDAFNTAHIRGAKLIPETDVAKRSAELPKDKLIVTYCS
jgi:3-mercaptopyruvate sulfurtransferase SseA